MKGGDRNALLRRAHAHEVSAVRAVPRHSRSDPIGFGDDILYRPAHIRQRNPRGGHPLLEPITAGYLVGDGVVINDVGCHELVKAVGVTSTDRVDDPVVHLLELFLAAHVAARLTSDAKDCPSSRRPSNFGFARGAEAQRWSVQLGLVRAMPASAHLEEPLRWCGFGVSQAVARKSHPRGDAPRAVVTGGHSMRCCTLGQPDSLRLAWTSAGTPPGVRSSAPSA